MKPYRGNPEDVAIEVRGGFRRAPCGKAAEPARRGIEEEFFARDITGHVTTERIARAGAWFKRSIEENCSGCYFQ